MCMYGYACVCTCMTQPGLSSRGRVTLAHSGSCEEGLHSTTPVYPSWDGNYGLGEQNHHCTAGRREGGTRPPSAHRPQRAHAKRPDMLFQ